MSASSHGRWRVLGNRRVPAHRTFAAGLVALAVVFASTPSGAGAVDVGDGGAGAEGPGHEPGATDAADTAGSGERRELLARARRAAPEQARRLGLNHRVELVVRDVVADADGTRHLRYDRTFAGLPVLGGDLVVHQRAGGRVYHVSRAHGGPVAVASTTPSVPRNTALRTASRLPDLQGEEAAADLVVYAVGTRPRLAWDAVVSGVGADGVPSRQHVVVDAGTGTVLGRWDDIRTVADGTGHSIYAGTVAIGTTATDIGFELRDPGHGGSVTTTPGGTVFVDADNVWGDSTQSDPHSAAVDVHWGTARTWDYYRQRHGRDGILGDGSPVVSRVHLNTSNAFWHSGTRTANYGDGPGRAKPFVELDVVAHELTHGVVQSTAGLTFTNEALALNEATADIFGTAVEWYTDSPQNAPDYLIGEELDLRDDGTPLRRMDHPEQGCWVENIDNFEVHIGAGPADHWFYLLAEGSGPKDLNGVPHTGPTCDGSSVEGIGRVAAARIWYRALTVYMTSAQTYPEARDDTIHAAIDLHGPDSPECAAVQAAWDAVDVPYLTTACGGGGKFRRAPAPRRPLGAQRREAPCDPGTEQSSEPGTADCDPHDTTVTGTLAHKGDQVYLPRPNGYFATDARTLRAHLDGPQGTDFDLRLQRWGGSRWVTVASSLGRFSQEDITYDALPGYYSWAVRSFDGAGTFTLTTD